MAKNIPEKKNVKEEKKAAVADVPADEKSAIKGAEEEDQGIDRKGVWEVTYESGAIIGYFEGTPKRIAEYVVSTDPEGRYIRKLRFTAFQVRKVPEKIMRETCCEKRFSKKDNFCSRCGKNLNMEAKLPSKLKIIVES